MELERLLRRRSLRRSSISISESTIQTAPSRPSTSPERSSRQPTLWSHLSLSISMFSSLWFDSICQEILDVFDVFLPIWLYPGIYVDFARNGFALFDYFLGKLAVLCQCHHLITLSLWFSILDFYFSVCLFCFRLGMCSTLKKFTHSRCSAKCLAESNYCLFVFSQGCLKWLTLEKQEGSSGKLFPIHNLGWWYLCLCFFFLFIFRVFTFCPLKKNLLFESLNWIWKWYSWDHILSWYFNIWCLWSRCA